MEWKRFWKLVESAYRDDAAEHFEALKESLAELSVDDLVAFQARFDELVDAAGRIDLWGAAYLINGGCSDDGFHDFRVWLIGRGRHPYEAALKNPDSLADILDGEPVTGFGLDVAAVRVYEDATNQDDFYDRLERFETDNPPPPPEGDDWDFDDEAEMRRHFPRLSRLYASTDSE